jgi:uncharacterized protein
MGNLLDKGIISIKMCICTIRIRIKRRIGMSPRGRKWRHCLPFTGDNIFKPRAIPINSLEIVSVGQDEIESMRLCDLEDLEQEDAAKKMGISRGTVQRLLYSGRKKVIEAITQSKALRVEGGEHIVPRRFCGHRRRWFRGRL